MITCNHELVDGTMPENGVKYPIKKCTKCGWWG
jgi:hypothetical protein